MISQHRIDLDLADPWAPEIILVEQPLTAAQSTRLCALIEAEPKVTLAAAVVVGPVRGPRGQYVVMVTSAARTVVLEPSGLSLSPVVGASTGTDETVTAAVVERGWGYSRIRRPTTSRTWTADQQRGGTAAQQKGP